MPDQNWDALERFKHSRGAIWTDGMASVVEHNLRHNWDFARRPDENWRRWDIRVNATYDYHYTVMIKWLGTPLPTAQAPGQKQWEHHPPKSEQLPEERGWHQPQEYPRATTEEARPTRRGAGSGPVHGHRNAPRATRRTHAGEQASGTGTHGTREAPRVPGMAQGTQGATSPLTPGLHTRSPRTDPCRPSSRVGDVSIMARRAEPPG